MLWIRALALALVAGCTAVVSLSTLAQAESAARRPKVDVRAMVPGMQASDAASEPRPAASGLTREQRKEATLQARQEGALQPAGEAADLRSDKPAPVPDTRPVPPATTTAMAEPAPRTAPETGAEVSPTIAPAAAPAAVKKSTRKKARAAAASTPA